jgi:hypothetical protein
VPQLGVGGVGIAQQGLLCKGRSISTSFPSSSSHRQCYPVDALGKSQRSLSVKQTDKVLMHGVKNVWRLKSQHLARR